MDGNFQIEVDGRGVFEPQNTNSRNPDVWLVDSLGGGRSDSGVNVNAQSALSHGPIWQGINILAGDQGMLPLVLMRRDGEDRVEDIGHPSSKVIRDRPNRDMLPHAFRELMVMRAILWGNGCAAIIRNEMTQLPQELLPLPPDATHPEYDSLGRLHIVTRLQSPNSSTPESFAFPYEDVFHLAGLSRDGVWGHSFVEVAKNTIGHGLALQRHGNKTFANGARPSGVLEHPSKLTPEARSQLRKEWNAIHQSVDNAGRIAILFEGMKFAPMSVSNADAEWLAAKKWDRREAAGLLNLPPFKLGAIEAEIRANMEQQNRMYLQSGLARWLNKWIEELTRKFLRPREAETRSHYWHWKTAAFLRGDLKSRYEAYRIGRDGEWLSPNEVREFEDMSPRPGGDDWANPNTRSAGDGSAGDGTAGKSMESVESEPVESESMEPNDLTRRLFAAECLTLATVECSKIRKAAHGEPNFIEWLDSFYGREWPARLRPLIKADNAAAYCAARHQEVLKLSDGNTADFVSRVERDSAQYREHARHLINIELGGNYHAGLS